MSGAELVEVISQLRDDLEAVMGVGEGRRVKFELGPVEVTLSVSVTSAGGGKAGVKFWVVEAGVDASVSRGNTQEIKLVLNPRDTQAALTSDGRLSSPLITGKATAGEAGIRDSGTKDP